MSSEPFTSIRSFLSPDQSSSSKREEIERNLHQKFNRSDIRRRYENATCIEAPVYKPHVLEIPEEDYVAVAHTSNGILYLGSFDLQHNRWELGKNLE